jgi:hypothetical protein
MTTEKIYTEAEAIQLAREAYEEGQWNSDGFKTFEQFLESKGLGASRDFDTLPE